MKLDVLGLFAACSYALDCVEAEFIHVTSKHARRVAYMSVCTAEQLGVQGKRLQDLAVCALHTVFQVKRIFRGFHFIQMSRM